MKLADMLAELAEKKSLIALLNKRVEGDAASDADVTELEAALKEHSELSAKIETHKTRAEAIRRATVVAAEEVAPDAPSAAATPLVEGVRDRAEDDPSAGFKTGRDYFKAIVAAGTPGAEADPRLMPLAAVGSDEHRGNSNPDGGFLIPEAFSPNLLQTDYAGDPTAGMVTNVPMQSPIVKIPARVDKNHSSSVTGGFKFYRRNEAETVLATKTQFEKVTLDAASIMGISFSTEELMKDSPASVAAIISQGFGTEFGSHMMTEKLFGTGVGELEGIFNNPALVTVPKESGQTADTIVGANIVKMRSRVWRYGDAVWLANADTYPQLCTAHISGTNSDVFLFTPGNGVDVPDTLLGRPIYFVEDMSTLGDLGDIACCNWSQYLYGDYQPIETASSMHVRFVYNEACFKISARNDGKCWWRSSLTPKKGSSTFSPFVTLAARA